MHKLTNMEAQRVITVLEDTLDRLTFLSYVPSSPDDDLLESLSLSGVVPPVRGSLQSQWQLEEGHQVMLGRSKEGMFLGKPGGESASLEVVDQLHQATRTLCRNLRKSPVAVEVLYSNHTQQRSPHFLSFLSNLEDLTKVMFRKLSTTVEEEITNKNLLQDLTDRERTAEDERDALQQTLEMQRGERDREVAVLDQTLTKLRAELQDITQSNQMEMQSIKQKMKENIEKADNEHLQRSKRLQDKLDQMTTDLANSSATHDEAEKALRKKKERLEADLSSLVLKYDSDMAEKLKQIQELEKQKKDETEQLITLEEHFRKIDANSAKQTDEEEILRKFKKRIQDATSYCDSKAMKIQALTRGVQCRGEVAKMLSKKGKKGGGGKKGKKK